MNYWIVPSNKMYFDVPKAFDRYGMIDWHKLCKYELGDVVYIYLSSPERRIAYKCIVTMETVKDDEVLDDSDFYIPPYNKETYIEGEKAGRPKKFSRFRLIEETKSLKLSFGCLKKIGIKSNIRGPLKNLTIEQINYIESCFNKHLDISLPEEIDTGISRKYYEGAIKKVEVDRYERDENARKACIAHYGTKCQVCGIDLGKAYGKIGEGYIEVHHIVPLSKIRKGYTPDPIKGMIPVCPNCHAMIHSAERKGYDVSDLSKIKKVLNK